jgi:hypothetical protein
LVAMCRLLHMEVCGFKLPCGMQRLKAHSGA